MIRINNIRYRKFVAGGIEDELLFNVNRIFSYFIYAGGNNNIKVVSARPDEMFRVNLIPNAPTKRNLIRYFNDQN